MRIAIICEGKTEKCFHSSLRLFLKSRLNQKMPKLDFVPQDGRIPKSSKLKQLVNRLLQDHRNPADAVIALTDVYTGTQPPDFQDAADAKEKMRVWVGDNPKFHPHVALFDFEAWLIPYWERIRQLAGSTKSKPNSDPENINHGNPPAHRLSELFLNGKKGKAYVKTRDARRILEGQDLLVAANECPELKLLLNTILGLCESSMID